MIDFIAHIFAVIEQILEAPQILALLILWFFVARFIGRLTVRLSWWKVVLALFVFPLIWPDLWSLSPILIAIFFAGILSNHTETIRGILAWSEGISDLIYAIRYRQAYEDISRRERELEEELRRAQAQAGARESQSQQRWREEAKQERTKSPPTGVGGRGEGTQDARGGGKTFHNAKQQQTRDPLATRYLTILGLDPGKRYSQTEIKAAFRKAVKTAHPDVGGSSEAMREVLAAYDWLTRNA